MAVELPGRVRKRLIGLQAIAQGASRPEAAKRAKAGLSTVDNWLRAARRSGWQSLMRGMPGTKPKKVKDAARLRKQVRRALSGKLDSPARTRLIAVDRVLGGDGVGVTAAELGFSRSAVSLWLRKLRRHGLNALLKKEPPRKRYIEANSAALRAGRQDTRSTLLEGAAQIPSAQPSILIVLASTAPFLGTCYWSPSMATISTLRASF